MHRLADVRYFPGKRKIRGRLRRFDSMRRRYGADRAGIWRQSRESKK